MITACSHGANTTAASAAHAIACPAADVRAVTLTIASRPADLTEPEPALSTTGAEAGVITLAARGPVLDAMHARDVAYRVDCTAGGVALEATIVQLASERGALLKNILWQPTITLQVTLQHATAEVRTIWRMRLPDGSELNRAQTPPYAEHAYPITVSTMLSRSPTQ